MGKKRLILGIDLGTTYSLACIQIGERFQFFSPEPGGSPLVPSVFFHEGNGQILIGAEAKNVLEFRGERSNDVVCHVKRYMKYNLPIGDRPAEVFKSGGKEFLPYQISGYILKALKEAAESTLNSPPKKFPEDAFHHEFAWANNSIDSAVITVPAYFGPRERRATEDAAKFAGFSPANVKLLDEPVAAALAMSLHTEPGRKLALIIDFGGGTCDISLLKVGRSVDHGGFVELGRIGDNDTGGIDFTREIVRRIVYGNPEKAAHYTAAELAALTDDRYPGILFELAEKEKIGLCGGDKGGRVEWREPQRNQLFSERVSRDWFFNRTDYLIEYCAQLCDQLLRNINRKDAELGRRGRGIGWKDIDRVCLVGGVSRMPQLKARIAARWGREPFVHEYPQRAVAEGAAIYAEMLGTGQQLEGIDKPRCPYDIGVMHKRGAQRTENWFRRMFARVWNGRDHKKQFQLDYDIQLLNTIRILDLPTFSSNQPPKPVEIEVVYDKDHRLSFKALYRGKPGEAEILPDQLQPEPLELPDREFHTLIPSNAVLDAQARQPFSVDNPKARKVQILVCQRRIARRRRDVNNERNEH